MNQTPKSIVVVGRRWFERTNGNTYHSVSVYVDGDCLVHVPFAYGYGNQYEETAAEELEKLAAGGTEKGRALGFAREHYASGAKESVRRWCQRHGVAYASEAVDVARKRDL
jgi:hypothetical protein